MADETNTPDFIDAGGDQIADRRTPVDWRDAEIAALKEEMGAVKDRLLRLAPRWKTCASLRTRKAEATLYAATISPAIC
jgi:hypothetical protein